MTNPFEPHKPLGPGATAPFNSYTIEYTSIIQYNNVNIRSLDYSIPFDR